jgi:hypothetical protein
MFKNILISFEPIQTSSSSLLANLLHKILNTKTGYLDRKTFSQNGLEYLAKYFRFKFGRKNSERES